MWKEIRYESPWKSNWVLWMLLMVSAKLCRFRCAFFWRRHICVPFFTNNNTQNMNANHIKVQQNGFSRIDLTNLMFAIMAPAEYSIWLIHKSNLSCKRLTERVYILYSLHRLLVHFNSLINAITLYEWKMHRVFSTIWILSGWMWTDCFAVPCTFRWYSLNCIYPPKIKWFDIHLTFLWMH